MVQLHHERIDQHEIADGQFATNDTLGRQQEHGAHAKCYYYTLAYIQQCQGCLTAYRRIFIAGHGVVKTISFVDFVAKILDSFEIQQTIDGPCIGFAVRAVHFPAML